MIKAIEELEQKLDILKTEKKELEQKINIVETSSNTINNELTHAVYILKTKYPEKLKIFEAFKNSEFNEEDYNFFKDTGKHKNTKTRCDPNFFDKDGIHKDTGKHKNTKDTSDPNGFDKDGIHKDTGKHYDPNYFNSYAINVQTKTKYDHKGFDINGFHKDTGKHYDPNDFDRNG